MLKEHILPLRLITQELKTSRMSRYGNVTVTLLSRYVT